jgi:hypothetical protein
MTSLSDRLNSVQQRLSRAVREHAALRTRAAELEGLVQDHQRMANMLKARVAELERENEVLRVARSAEGGSSATGTKEKIDELVNEIDRCLALISA